MSTLASRGLRPAAELAADKPHGTRLRYIAGCKCFQCRRANSDYERSRKAARLAGDWNGFVSADRARAHLMSLSRRGVGKRAVQSASDVALSVLTEIRTGRKQRIRARTERKILAVTPAQASDRALVKPGRTHQLIEQLVEEGFTKRELARRLGYASPALHFQPKRMTARNVARVERLHRSLTT
ncbi:MAG TPA: hypothetical protein PKC95_00285 [Thauera aminoaromatica]|nr:hypothetical protein [Thauera aminoaromatica]